LRSRRFEGIEPAASRFLVPPTATSIGMVLLPAVGYGPRGRLQQGNGLNALILALLPFSPFGR
jgi:hypothetical protein